MNEIKRQKYENKACKVCDKMLCSLILKKDIFYKTIGKRQQSNGKYRQRTETGHSQKTQLANKNKTFHLTISSANESKI